jgi:predicted Zn-dependent peptidase
MIEEIIELKEGIKAHLIKNDIFKTNLICVMLTVPLKKENVTKNSLIPFLLKRGTMNYKSQEEINIKLEELYGAGLDCGIDKIGDNQAIKFYIESIDNNYTLNGEDLLKDSIDLILDITFNPLLKNNEFEESFLETEKNNLKKIIEGKINNKDLYAFNRCIENMYDSKGFGIYKYGYLEDLEKITNQEISKHYLKLINEAKIDIYISGNFEISSVNNILKDNLNLTKLKGRKENYVINNPSTEIAKKVDKPKEVFEKLNVNQGKLVIGLDVLNNIENLTNIGIITNSILGDGANSMLFQNVREKAGLAYTAKSTFNKLKNNIFIRCGIEIPNYEKAVKLINEQIENIKQGNFTEKDLQNAKNYIVSGIKTIETEQDTQIVFYIGQEISKIRYSINEYINSINSVTKDQVIEFAKNLQVNTIYFLTNQEETKKVQNDEDI